MYHVLELGHHGVARSRPAEGEEEVVVLRVLDGSRGRPEELCAGWTDIS